MKFAMAYGLSLVVLFGAGVVSSAWGQYGTEGSTQRASPEQLAECKSIGIPEFTCTEQTLLAKRRLLTAQANPQTGSGTPMLSTGFGEMGAIIGALAAIFGGVAVMFFARSRVGKRAEA